jgi:PKD repeat protein
MKGKCVTSRSKIQNHHQFMRKRLLLGALLCGLFTLQAWAQKPTTQWLGHLTPDVESAPNSVLRLEPGPVINPMPLTGGCPGNDVVGTSSNVFTNILTEANPIAVDNEINSIVFLHRNNATAFGGHSGQLRYDLSTNGGLTWSSNLGVLNPLAVNGTNGARYPNVAIHNPPGNTNPNNAYLSYYAATVATAFNGTVSGVRKLDGTGNTETYNQPTATQTLIPRAVVKGAPGTFWSIDNVFNGTVVTGYRVLKGVWNGSTDVVWSVNTTLTPTFNIGYDGAVKTADYAIAFDPTGNIGWICMLTHVTPGPTPYAFYPVFYKTTNGGTNWTGPTTVDLGQSPCLAANMQVGNVVSAGFDLDLTVDVNGNPHALMPVCNGNSAYAVFYTQWHAMVDVTMSDGVWNPVIVRNVYRGRGTWGTAPNAVTQDMEPQIARTPDGTKIFYTWTDADSTVLQATADQSPNLFAKAYDVVARKWTNSYNMTTCNTTWNGKLFFPKMAETVLTNTGNYKLPIVYAQMGGANDPIAVATFHYLDSVWFAPSDFINNQCQATVNISNTDTIFACTNITLDAGVGGQQYAWNTGATTQAITVTASGTYSVGVSANCCTGSDTVVVVMLTTPVAGFSSNAIGFALSFTNTSTGAYTSYAWDFGDGNSSTDMNPSHTYAGPGTYQVCLIAGNQCGSDTICQTLNITCAPANASWSYLSSTLTASFTDMTAGNPTAWAWDFGDGNTSTVQNPTHTYAAGGTYNVCLTTTDSCGSDSTCLPVVVCQLPVAAFTHTFPGLPGDVDFTDASTGGTSWLWDFGDGGTSTVQNPTHTYAFAGTYTVCLTTTDACGSDTACNSITVLIEAIGAGMPGQWSVSPIPTHDLLKISAQDAGAGMMQLRLMNALGQILLERGINHAGGALQQQLDLSALPSGIYYLSVRNDQGSFVAKVIKE